MQCDDDSMLDLLRAANEPTRCALAMAQAICRHLEDVAEDEPGDDPAIESALTEASTTTRELVALLERATRRL
jgi:hypothetical protein